MKNKFLILWLAGILSTVIALPYIFALQQGVIDKITSPLPLISLLAIGQSAILLAIAIFFGLRLSRSIQMPQLDFSSLKKNLGSILRLSVPLGIAIALVIKFLDIYFINQIPQIAVAAARIPFWKALLVAPYGGVVEELLLRLFVVSLFAWLIGKITKTKGVVKSNVIMWTSITLAAVLFGIGHLPATASITPLTPIVITRAILLNGIGGMVFGWLYWKRGLEYGIVAHFTTDIVLHAILPFL